MVNGTDLFGKQNITEAGKTLDFRPTNRQKSLHQRPKAMAKKPKSKKGAGGPAESGKGGEEAKEKITEVDKEWFQIQVDSFDQ